MMIRLLTLCCILSLGRMLSFAQAENTSVLYEISGGGLTHNSYVFGTIHLRDKRVFEQVYDKKDSLWYCFKHCDIIAGELKLDDKELNKAVMEAVLLPNGMTLKHYMFAADYQKVFGYASELLGWKAIIIDRLKPQFTITLLAEAMEKSDCKYPMDMYLQQQGNKMKKEIVGLETIDEQLSALSNQSIVDQAKELLDFVNHSKESKQELDKLIDLYVERRLIDLYDAINELDMSDTLEAFLINDRNKLMVYRMETFMLSKPVFVAIGAAHLPGDLGVLELLRKKGYIVRAVDRAKTANNKRVYK